MPQRKLYADAKERSREQSRRRRVREGTARTVMPRTDLPAHPQRMPIEATRAHIAAMQERRDARAAADAAAVANAERSKREHDNASVVQLYRAERDAKQQRHAGVMGEAKAQYERMLADLNASRKGGRPRKALNVRRDPADALVEAMERRDHR